MSYSKNIKSLNNNSYNNIFLIIQKESIFDNI